MPNKSRDDGGIEVVTTGNAQKNRTTTADPTRLDSHSPAGKSQHDHTAMLERNLLRV